VVNFDILFGSGIDTMGCMLDAAQELNVVERKGSWYAYKGTNIAQGRLNVVELLKSDPSLAAQMETEVRLALSNYGTSVGDTELEVEMHDDGLDMVKMESDIVESYLE
jgi:recombination protein RecA